MTEIGSEVIADDVVDGQAPDALVQPDLHHGRLGRARLGPADPPAGRYARSDGQALGRDHRDPHHHQLPRGSVGPPVLHLDPRRPQGSRRHRAQDRQLRVPHPPSGRRGAGLRHRRVRLRHHGRHRDHGPGRGRRDHREARRPHPGPRRPRRTSSIPYTGEVLVQAQRGDHRGQGPHHRGRRHRQGEDPLGAHLRDPARDLRALLRPRPGPRAHGQHRRGGRRHRRPVHRRARHPADDADLPHRRRRSGAHRAVTARGPLRRSRQAGERRAGQAREALHRHEPPRRDRHPGRHRPRARALRPDLRRQAVLRRRREGEAGPAAVRVGSVLGADPHRGRRAS